MFFDFGRSEGFPTQYASNRTPVTVDILEAGFILAAFILVISFSISVIQTKFLPNVFLYTRITLNILIGLLLLLGNFGQEWEVGHIQSKTPYKAGSAVEINATIGLKIGLRSVNITLKSEVAPGSPLQHEQIDYNERFHWTWDQGRFGFGPYAGLFQREFREAQYRGVPTPILWIADYFVIDGEGFRHGRFYRTAGWYSHIAMWSAFPCWLLANLFFRSVIRYGAYSLGLAGILQLVANLLWLVIRNPNPLVIPFEDATITTKFGVSYWLTFFCAILCIILCIIITIGEKYWTHDMHFYFGIDSLKSTDETYIEDSIEEEENQVPGDNHHDQLPLMEMRGGSRMPSSRRSTVIHVRRNTKRIVRRVTREPEPEYGNVFVDQDVIYDNVVSGSSAPPPPKRKIR